MANAPNLLMPFKNKINPLAAGGCGALRIRLPSYRSAYNNDHGFYVSLRQDPLPYFDLWIR